MLSFNDTRIAFSGKTEKELKKAYRLFLLVKHQGLTKAGSVLITLANNLKLPVGWALKNTVYSHFCGGETIIDCQKTIGKLAQANIKSILDYAAEGVENETLFDEAKERIITTIDMASKNPGIGFAVFKFSGIARSTLLEKVSTQAALSKIEQMEYERVIQRADDICRFAGKSGVPVMIDAEETWLQGAIDEITENLMKKYNRDIVVVYHTLQLYRIDKLYYLKDITAKANKEGFFPGFKLVRGAYLEKENERARKKGYKSPIHPDKTSTDKAFNEALRFCIEKIDHLALCIGTHNEESCLEAVNYMEINRLPNNHPKIHFSQLLGMSDHISYNLSGEGFNVAKYVPYGPVNLALPYLIRRASENTSVAGQTSRELQLIEKELSRRKNEKKPLTK